MTGVSDSDHPRDPGAAGDSGFDTLAVRAGQHRTNEQEQAEPIFTTSSFVFRSAQEAANRFAGVDEGNIYSRFTNPTVRTFENRLAALEGGEACVATASGMAGIAALVLGLLQQGDHVVAGRGVFGSTRVFFERFFPRYGLSVSWVPTTEPAAWREAIQPNTRLFFLETPTNPTLELGDIPALAEIARAHDVLLAVDNCFCTPALQRPLELGAHLVTHSATKYLDGQGRIVGGAVVGDRHHVGESIYGFLRTVGPTLSPFNAWVALKGLETLRLRMAAHSRNAQRLADVLAEEPGVRAVRYPGLRSHPQYALAVRQQRDFGGIVSFEVEGGQETAWRLIDRTRLLSITANLGDTKSTITHPASTTHGRLTEAQRQAMGIGPGMIRIAVGLEDFDDIWADVRQALQGARSGA